MQDPRVGLLLGDACGIGPEIVAKLLASDVLDREVATVVIGEPRILARAQAIVGSALEPRRIGPRSRSSWSIPCSGAGASRGR